MAVTGGYQPGTYQANDLNRLQSIFGTAGLARGMQVTQTSPLGMSVYVTVDGVAGDGVCYVPNGGWVRIDAQLTLSVPSNSSGSTRNDAVVATMDPTGVSGLPSVQYITNWAGGFNGGNNNQLVLALVSVANNATQVVSGNITQNQAAASFGSAKTAGLANTVGPIATSNGAYVSQMQTSTVGFGLGIIDNTASGLVEVMPVALSGTARGMTLGWTDTANAYHIGVQVNTNGDAVLAQNVTAVGTVTASQVRSPLISLDPIPLHGEAANSLTLKGVNPGSGSGNVDIHLGNPTTGWVYFDMASGSAHIDVTGGLAANVVSDSGGSIFPKFNTTGMRIFAAGTTAGITFQKYDLFVLLPFN